MDVLLEEAEPLDAYAMVYSYGGYTTNLAIEDLTDGKAWVVTEHEGEPLPREHGGPARLLVPHLYFWKSAKWVAGTPGDGPRRARVLGRQRLPQPRRSLEGGALLDGLTAGRYPVAQRAPGRWQIGTVTSIKRETPRVKSFRIELPMWMPHLPGQHYDVRLTAPDGYRAQRSYSIASSPLDEGEIELTIDRLDDGEVSPYFHDVVVEGDQVEVRGPFASYFVWRGEEPVLLVGGGLWGGSVDGDASPPPADDARVADAPGLLGAQSAEDVIYSDELGDETLLTFTREPPGDGAGTAGGSIRRSSHTAGIEGGVAFRLWLERVRRGGLPAPAAGRSRASADPHRALRPHRLSDGRDPGRGRKQGVRVFGGGPDDGG